MNCPHCGVEIEDAKLARHLASKGGASTSPAKRVAARRNGRLGGRPPERGRRVKHPNTGPHTKRRR